MVSLVFVCRSTWDELLIPVFPLSLIDPVWSLWTLSLQSVVNFRVVLNEAFHCIIL